tara:strand:- start:3 stop:1199 length:1197 start_codon:yes stop_codon:yes gene_type:complete
MAITKLADIITVFENKWVFGDTKFGYETEVNQDHNASYPLMLIQPPSSIIPLIYNGREEYEFEINFYNLYSQRTQSAVTLQKRWDDLQDLVNEWLDTVLKNYTSPTVQAYLNDESVEIERVKEVANDRLVQLKLTFTMSAFAHCFYPIKSAPSTYDDLVIWLRTNTYGVELSTSDATKVSDWNDQSGNSNNVSQSSSTYQPTWRSTWVNFNNLPAVDFTGVPVHLHYLDSGTTVRNPITGNDFTVFLVTEYELNTDEPTRPVYTYIDNDSGAAIQIGNGLGGNFKARVVDDEENEIIVNKSGNTTLPSITATKLSGRNLSIRLFQAGDSEGAADTQQGALAFDATGYLKLAKYGIGGLSGDDQYVIGQVAEVIVYNRALTFGEETEIVNYLNDKYKIY